MALAALESAIIDDDGLRVFAGPFESEATAIAWIIQRQETMTLRHQDGEGYRHQNHMCSATIKMDVTILIVALDTSALAQSTSRNWHARAEHPQLPS